MTTLIMSEEDKNEYLKIAQNVGVFNHEEIEVILEILEEYKRFPEKDYFLFEEREGETITGFLLFGKNSLTKFCWEVYWLVVNKNFQGRGIGKKLMKRMEEFILPKEDKAIIRLETSSKTEYAHARRLYERLEFNEAVRIPNFYDQGDDLMIYYKQIGNLDPDELLYDYQNRQEASVSTHNLQNASI
ncbi:MAG: GNAT family N-acetyltransferase [Candidatus Omnitrophica bacterium]|nr:GNAT family N-acetyltransferase [Candidatus Omnitrophota bacterium]